jgi:predicted RNase H-like HicB family nuclease
MAATRKHIKSKKEKVSVTFDGTIPVVFFREEEVFIAHCPVLDLSTCGETYDEALNNFNEALSLFFEECIEKGTLPKVLEASGWKLTGRLKNKLVARPPVYLGDRQVSLPQAA